LEDYFIIFGAILQAQTIHRVVSQISLITTTIRYTLNPMIQKVRLSRLFIASTLLSTILCAQEVSPTKRTLSFQSLKPSPTHCQLGLKAQFLDDTTLLISNPICAKGGVESSHQHALANLDGNIRNSIELGQGSRYAYIGPPGYLLFPAEHPGWLIFDTDLHPKGTLPIPSGEFPGNIVLSPSRTAVALSSGTPGDHYSTYHWQLLTGNPLSKTAEYTGPLPFPGITDAGAVAPVGKSKLADFEPIPGDLWFFDTHYQLTRRSNTGTETALPEATWLAPESKETWCSEELSVSQQRHILVHCMTTYYLPRAIGGFLTHGLPLFHLRYVVYDATGKILTKGTYPFDSPPSLSPNGRLLALTQEKNVILYDLP
jgi:hypothetical protein